MDKINLSYKQIQIMRELLIEEMRASFTTISVEHLKLVEMRLQTLIMARLDKDAIELERKNFKTS